MGGLSIHALQVSFADKKTEKFVLKTTTNKTKTEMMACSHLV